MDHLFKVLVIGNVRVGKSSIVQRYVRKSFSPNYKTTIGVDFLLKTLQWDARTVVRLQLWDIAGQEQTRSMSRVYYKEARGALVVFDLTDRSSLEAAAAWKRDLDSKVSRDSEGPVPALLLANKCDLLERRDRERVAPSLDDFCNEQGFAGWLETSAKDDVNIEEAGALLVELMMASGGDARDQRDRGVVKPGGLAGHGAPCC